MLNLAKPYAGPIILFLAEWGLGMTDYESDFIGGLLIGAAVFWLVVALFSNKALFKRFPGILDWAPFLDPTGGFSTAEQLTGRFISNQTFNISLISQDGVIEGRTFEDCVIYGPAVLLCEGVGHIYKCTFDGPESLVETSQEKVIGPIRVIDTSFKRCKLIKIGILGSPEIIAKYKEGFNDGSGQISKP